jgi:uncharacterized protein YqeY
MSIVENVSKQLTAAMKAREVARISALRMIRAALIEETKREGIEPDDEKAMEVLRRLRKQRDESAEAYEQAGRSDLAELELAEAAVIDGFLPRLADEATTAAWVREAIAVSGATSVRELGKAMGALMKAHRGELDAKLARSLIERELAG